MLKIGPTPSPRAPRGSVLLFTLVILVLLGLMGFSIMLNTRSELTISQTTYQGRDAFARADSTARLALFMGRVLLRPSAGEPCDILNNSGSAFKVEVGDDGLCAGFSLSNIQEDWGKPPTMEDVLKRYSRATKGSGGLPPIVIKHDHGFGDQVVGTAAIAIYRPTPSEDPGGSLGDSGYGSQGEHSFSVYLVVSADGRLSRLKGDDAGNYYGDYDDAGQLLDEQPTHSIITAIYRELIVQ